MIIGVGEWGSLGGSTGRGGDEVAVTLEKVQACAAEVDRLFPLALASQGTCQIGGNLSTNAGGVGVAGFDDDAHDRLGVGASDV